MADIRELAMAIGFKKQANLATPLVAADCWRLHQTSRNVGQPLFNNESDREDIGKGTPFATQLFPSHLDATWQWDYYLTSENAAMVGVYGVGLTTKAAAGTGFLYTCNPPDSFDVSMPSTTLVQAVRQGGTDVFDFAMFGMCCEEFTLNLNSGVGRQAANISSQWVGTGDYVSPSTITIPSATTEHNLTAGGVTTLTINSVNYITNQRFVSAQLRFKNNIRLDTGYYPGSGTQDNYQIRGRMRRADPELTFSFVAEFVDGSTELADLLAQTEGTASIIIEGATIGAGPEKHKLDISLKRIVYSATPIGDQDGILTVAVEAECLKHDTNGVMDWKVTTEQDNIGTAAT